MKLPPDLERRVLELAGEQAPPVAATVSEEEFLQAVIALAKRCGWLVYHTRSSRKSDAGYPDLTLFGHGKTLWAELKTETGTLTADQERFRDAIRAAGGEWHLWKPSDWKEIERTLA